jgi:hypothetical protein
MRFSIAMLLGLLTSMQATSESLDFAIYRLTGDERTLIADGARNYTVSDLDVKKWGCMNGRQAWKRAVQLEEGFSISVLVIRKGQDQGFGLSVDNINHPDGFSWEWFEPDNGDIYKKLQGEGYVRVTQAEHEDGVEIQSVEFLSEITLRFMEDVKEETGKRTHLVVVSQGSVFRFDSDPVADAYADGKACQARSAGADAQRNR